MSNPRNKKLRLVIKLFKPDASTKQNVVLNHARVRLF